MSRPKNQHWVPQFYLRHFATPETRTTRQPRVWIFSVDPSDGDETLTSIRNVCAKRYLYSPRGTSGEREWELDQKLERFEGTLAPTWSMLATGYLNLGDTSLRQDLSLFVALTHLRDPHSLRTVEEVHRRTVAMFEKAPTKSDGCPDVNFVEVNGEVCSIDTSEWRAYKAQDRDDYQRAFARLIHSAAISMAEALMAKRWSMIVAQCDTFVTSDKPVAIQHADKRTCGYGTPGSVVTFPVSPTRLLVMDDLHGEPANQYYPLDVPNRGGFNYNIWRNGSRFMITGRSVPEVLSELVGWADSQRV